MQRLRSLHTKTRYTQVSNDAIDRLPDLNSLGLLVTYLRHHDDFDFDLKGFLRAKAGIGEQAGYKARSTLIQHGYLVQVKFKHSYRGRFHTDIWRAAEPFTEADLAEIAAEYVLGSAKRITVGADDAGEPIRKNVIVRWVEMTSFRGTEATTGAVDEPTLPPEFAPVDNSAPEPTPVDNSSGPVPAPVDNSGESSGISPGKSVKHQVAPDPGFPGPGHPDPGEPGSLKKNSKKTNENLSVRPERNAGARDGAAADGRTDGNPPEPEMQGPPRGVVVEVPAEGSAASMLADPAVSAHLVRIDMRPEQRRRLEAAVDSALLRFSPGQVNRYLHEKARDAETAMYVVRAFEMYADAIVLIGDPGLATARRTDTQFLEDLAAAPAAPERPRCPDHPASGRRAGGECSGCYAEQFS